MSFLAVEKMRVLLRTARVVFRDVIPTDQQIGTLEFKGVYAWRPR
jgi:hypothetical protein